MGAQGGRVRERMGAGSAERGKGGRRLVVVVVGMGVGRGADIKAEQRAR